MAKIHTRMKRKMGKQNLTYFIREEDKAKRPKTFGSEESAKTWAKENNVTIKELKSVKRGKRYEIIPE